MTPGKRYPKLQYARDEPLTYFMNTIENPLSATSRDQRAPSARSERVTTVAWLTGITAVVALGVLSTDASVGMGLGILGVSGMVAAVSYFILRG